LIVTNKYNLPQALFNLVSEEYEVKANEYRVTSLLKGFKEIMITRHFKDKITVDVSDMIWLLFGKAVHYMLEQQELKPSELKEKRLYMPFGDYTLSGQFDLYDTADKKLTDYKTASVWKVIHNDFDDWYRQGSIYAMLMQQAGMPVEKLEFIAFLKDHSSNKALFNSDYPDHAVSKVIFNLKESDIKWARSFVEDKFKAIRRYENVPVDDIPPCSPEERWQEPSTYAVTKQGRKSALKVEDSEEKAWAWVKKKVKEKDLPGISVVLRPGSNKKCNSYCFANQFCNFYQEHANSLKEVV